MCVGRIGRWDEVGYAGRNREGGEKGGGRDHQSGDNDRNEADRKATSAGLR